MSIIHIIKQIFNNKKNINLEEYYLNNNKSNPYTYQEKYYNQENILLKTFGNVHNTLPNILKTIIITDTHGNLKENELINTINDHQDYDICILLGDHTNNDIELILKHIPKSKLYALLGNHDSNYIKGYELNNLNGNIIEIKGIKILGIEGSFKYKPSDFPSFTQEESITFLNNKQPVDILFSHDGPFNNNKTNPAHQGLFGITYYLFKNHIKYNVHGHIHEHYEKELINGTKEISLHEINYYEFK